jgi:2-polyprenyl-3-methyl-5-hydroxy-6-metoxy-1,4-benzoquinol methylase
MHNGSSKYDGAMYQYHWLPAGLVQPSQVEDFARFYSEHYGIWSEQGRKPGSSIKISAAFLQKWMTKDALVVWATALDSLVGYAITVQTTMPRLGRVAWITQLVVHKKHRHQDVGKALVFSMWGFTDHFAWGVLSANPYAVRALEKATRRRCHPVPIRLHAKQLLELGQKYVPYISLASEVVATDTESRINTEFFVDHSELEVMLHAVINEDHPWMLGPLPEGWEWFAFTFRHQPQIHLSAAELDEMLSASDQITREAYSRMPMQSASQRWARFADIEAEFIVKNCKLAPGTNVLDFGCGVGRHTLALASRGVSATGVDYIRSFIESAEAEAADSPSQAARFVDADCRSVSLGESFDAGICLYDVIGSYADDSKNLEILSNLVTHIKPGGYVLLSVMNMELTERVARHWFSIEEEPDALLSLQPSATMETTGDVFNPDFYMIDRLTRIVYRKEQFRFGEALPEELIVRDRRYSRLQIQKLCEKAGLDVIWVRLVRAGHWDEPLDPSSDSAKEILVLCKRPDERDFQIPLF